MKNETLTKQNTKTLLIHATNASSTKEVANILNVPPSRISEGKGGRWRLNIDQISTLIEVFGPPKAVQGYYAEAEVFNSFGKFKDNFERNSIRLQLRRFLTAIYGKPCQAFLLRSVVLSDDNHGDESTIAKDKFRIINELIYSPAFEKWHTFLKSQPDENIHNHSRLDQARFINLGNLSQLGLEAAVNTYSDSGEIEPGSLMETIKSLGADDISGMFGPGSADEILDKTRKRSIGPTSSPYFLIGELVYAYQEIAGLLDLALPAKVIFNSRNPLAEIPKETAEVVITGDIVYDLENEKLPNPSTCTDFLNLFPKQQIRQYGLNSLEGLGGISDYGFSYLGPAVYSHINAKLFLSKSLSYHLYFELYNPINTKYSGNFRSIVIEEIPGDKVFQILDELRAHFGLETIPLFDIKKGIAAKGGFIPGARYFE
ncbi:MAG: hypothetical protein P8X74_18555 [Reinekea sp.]